MTIQNSVTVRNAELDSFETATGAAPSLFIRTGTQPTNCAAADSGTLILQMSLPADWLSSASGGTKSLLGTWSGVAIAGGNPGHYRIKDQAGNCHEQGLVASSVILNTSAQTLAGSGILTFAATTGIVVGMSAVGTGVPANATVIAVTPTTVTLSKTIASAVSSGAAITFNADITVTQGTISVGQTVTIGSYTKTAGNA